MKKYSKRACARLLALAMAGAMMLSGIAIGTKSAQAKAKVKVSKVWISNVKNKKLKLPAGKSYSLKTQVKVSPNKKQYRKVKYSSSNKKIASVSSAGKIMAKKSGKTIITATSKVDKKKKAKIVVTVTGGDVAVKSVKISKTSLELLVDDEYTLKATVNPKNATNKGVQWISSNEKVAEVDDDGVVKGIAAGTATITVMSDDDDSKKASCKVTVKEDTSTSASNGTSNNTPATQPPAVPTQNVPEKTETPATETPVTEPPAATTEPAVETPAASKEPTIAPSKIPVSEDQPFDDIDTSFSLMQVDLETVNTPVGGDVEYDDSKGILSIVDTALVTFELPEIAPEGAIVKVNIIGTLKGEKGFRSYLIPGTDNAVSNIANCEEDGIELGDFNWTYELIADSDASHIQLKGITWQDEIDDLEIKKITVAYRMDGEGAPVKPSESTEPNETETPAQPGGDQSFDELDDSYKVADLDLSTATAYDGEEVNYDAESKTLSITDVSRVAFDLPETLLEGSTVKVNIVGTMKGEKGLRSYLLTDDADIGVSNIANSEEDGIELGEFNWTYTLDATADVSKLQVKGITYDSLIDDVEISKITVAYKAADAADVSGDSGESGDPDEADAPGESDELDDSGETEQPPEDDQPADDVE